MPLIARVMDAADSNSPISTASPSPPGPAASPACASASPPRAASRSPPASRRRADDARRFRRPLIAADDATPSSAAIDARHEQGLSAGVRPGGRTLVPPRVAPLREAVRAALTGPARIVGSAAQAGRGGVAEATSRRPIWSTARGAATSAGSRGSAPPPPTPTAPPQAALSAPARCPAAGRRPRCRADDRHSSPRACSHAASRCSRKPTPRDAARDRCAARRLVPPRLERRRFRAACCSTAPCWRTAPCCGRSLVGFILSRVVVGRSRDPLGRRPHAPARRAWRAAARPASAPARRARRARGLSRGRSRTTCRRCGSTGGPVSGKSAAAMAIIATPPARLRPR